MRWLVGVCVLGGAIPAGLALAAQSHTVDTVGLSSFDPETLTVAVGDTVTWHNNGGTHSVDFDNGSVNTAPTSGATLATHTFQTPGTFRYYCEVHGGPNGFGMSGRVIVQGAAGTPTPTATATATESPTATASPTATPYYNLPSVTSLRVNRKVFRGRVRGSFKARPVGRKVRVRIRRRGLVVGRSTKFALPRRTGFRVDLARSVRRALRRGRHPKVRVTAKLGRASASKTVRLRKRFP